MTTKATNPYGTTPETKVVNPYGTTPEANVANPHGTTPETKTVNPSFGATPKAGVNYSNVDSPEARAHGGTPEGNTNNPYGTKPQANVANPYGTNPQARTANPHGTNPQARTANPSFGATKPVTESELKTIRFGAGQRGGAARQPLSMVSYKLFLRTGMYYDTTLEGNPLTEANHDAAREDFETELTALREQVAANYTNQALTLEFEPLRNNYWLNNNGYDQFFPPTP